MKTAFALMLMLVAGPGLATELDRTPLEATTVGGEKVRLYPNGRWKFVDAAKAAEAEKLAGEYPENKARPAEAQGGVFGVGRLLMPGDKDYNRGSLNPKLR
ncbi:hypothetical protein [Dechloromonas sp. HYN0024]|uniref:hypothetical protein n=1 Tax=Dechloromonas sp. HYN0024 TaxID=2231055 RepID=UPI000E44735C|nr:hypothetical protein [Dechloromonas sp. HYN0024]AXS80665.1 hypothetical protein HYN24_11925 [Dechloromonas sp. HYN0024]